jgi:hypothetical protein
MITKQHNPVYANATNTEFDAFDLSAEKTNKYTNAISEASVAFTVSEMLSSASLPLGFIPANMAPDVVPAIN